MEETKNAYNILVGKPDGESRRRWRKYYKYYNGSLGNKVGSCGLDASGSG
jgi:hypothetical protein